MPVMPPQLVGNVSPFGTHTYVVLTSGSCAVVVLQQYSVSVHMTFPFDPSAHTFWDARPAEQPFALLEHPNLILPEFRMQQYGVLGSLLKPCPRSSPTQVFSAPEKAHVSRSPVGTGVGMGVGELVGGVDGLFVGERVIVGWIEGCNVGWELGAKDTDDLSVGGDDGALDNDGDRLGRFDGDVLTDGTSLGFDVGDPVSVGTCEGIKDGC